MRITATTIAAAAHASRSPITGAALEAAADFAAFMLRRQPEQLLGAAAETLPAAQMRQLRALLERVYTPALRLAGRTSETANPPGRDGWLF